MKFNFKNILNYFDTSTEITYENVLAAHINTPKRICFQSSHSNALLEINFNDVKWALNLPFEESVKKIFESETGLYLFKKKNGKYWCPIKTEEDFITTREFTLKYEVNVFLRDTLDLSMSLSMNFDSNFERTEIGELEYNAKYNKCKQSITKISDLIANFINNTPFFNEADYICSVPSSKRRDKNLPNKIVKIASKKISPKNISKNVLWKKEKTSLKNESFNDKWKSLDETGVKIEINLKNKTVILLDDLYQSGTTIQYIAMKLKEAGAVKIYGLTIVKSLRDTDNR